jgi:hypothetical protein
MPRVLPKPRPISIKEIAVVERALAVGAVDDEASRLMASVRTLQVVARCDCGCASVDFLLLQPGVIAHKVADAVASAPDGEHLGLIVWADNGALSALEIYNFTERPAPLPTIPSIHGYGSSASIDAA